MAGRAVWKEAVTLDSKKRNDFLKNVGYERMRRLQLLCEELGRPFTEIYHAPELSYDWYL